MQYLGQYLSYYIQTWHDGRPICAALKLPLNSDFTDILLWSRFLTANVSGSLNLSSRRIVRRTWHQQDTSLWQGKGFNFKTHCYKELAAAIHIPCGWKGLQDTLLEGTGSSNTHSSWQGKGFRAHCLKEQPPAIHIPCGRERAARRIVRRNWLQQHTSMWQGKGYNFKTHCQNELAAALHLLVAGKGRQDTLLEGTGSSTTHSLWRERASRHIVRRNWQQQDITLWWERASIHTYC